MHQHEFLFSPGRWVGGGKITFSTSSQLIRFYTSWVVTRASDNSIICVQRVEMQPLDEVVNNNFHVFDLQGTHFKINLESEFVSAPAGTGLIDEKTIAWEFRGQDGLEGFEVYELQENGDYMFHAEYSSIDQFRTIVDGRIWKKPT